MKILYNYGHMFSIKYSKNYQRACDLIFIFCVREQRITLPKSSCLLGKIIFYHREKLAGMQESKREFSAVPDSDELWQNQIKTDHVFLTDCTAASSASMIPSVKLGELQALLENSPHRLGHTSSRLEHPISNTWLGLWYKVEVFYFSTRRASLKGLPARLAGVSVVITSQLDLTLH